MQFWQTGLSSPHFIRRFRHARGRNISRLWSRFRVELTQASGLGPLSALCLRSRSLGWWWIDIMSRCLFLIQGPTCERGRIGGFWVFHAGLPQMLFHFSAKSKWMPHPVTAREVAQQRHRRVVFCVSGTGRRLARWILRRPWNETLCSAPPRCLRCGDYRQTCETCRLQRQSSLRESDTEARIISIPQLRLGSEDWRGARTEYSVQYLSWLAWDS